MCPWPLEISYLDAMTGWMVVLILLPDIVMVPAILMVGDLLEVEPRVKDILVRFSRLQTESSKATFRLPFGDDTTIEGSTKNICRRLQRV